MPHQASRLLDWPRGGLIKKAAKMAQYSPYLSGGIGVFESSPALCAEFLAEPLGHIGERPGCRGWVDVRARAGGSEHARFNLNILLLEMSREHLRQIARPSDAGRITVTLLRIDGDECTIFLRYQAAPIHEDVIVRFRPGRGDSGQDLCRGVLREVDRRAACR